MKFAVVDLECTSLKADQGFLLCGGIKPIGGEKRIITYKETGFGRSRKDIDKHLAVAIRDEMEKYDGWITWNGLMFDIPYLDDRLLLTGGQRPHRPTFHCDLMWYYRQGKSTFTSSRLDWVASQLGVPFQKTKLDIGLWKQAEAEAIVEALTKFRTGRQAYNYIVEHNDADLDVTDAVFEITKPRIRQLVRR